MNIFLMLCQQSSCCSYICLFSSVSAMAFMSLHASLYLPISIYIHVCVSVHFCAIDQICRNNLLRPCYYTLTAFADEQRKKCRNKCKKTFLKPIKNLTVFAFFPFIFFKMLFSCHFHFFFLCWAQSKLQLVKTSDNRKC